MMECSSCHKPNRPAAKFCKWCGTAMTSSSANVGERQEDQLLDQITGLDDLKSVVQREVTAFKNMRTAGFKYDARNLHAIIMGNSGTGKNKVVEALSKAYFKTGITTKPDPKIISAVDFAEFSRNLPANIDAAKGGILCIDNAHQLTPDGYQAGQSLPIDKLYAEMGMRAGDPIIVLCSKPDGFRDYLEANHDVNNRFNLKFYLPDMNVDQMLQLAEWFVKEKKFQMDDNVRSKLKKRLLYLFRHQQDAEQSLHIGKNGFLVHKEMNKIFSDHFINPSFMQSPTTLLESDIKGEVYETSSVEDVLKELDDFIGMDGVKGFLEKMTNLLRIGQKDAAATGKEQTIGSHIVLTGNPGTGKTTLARKLGEVFAASGILSSGHVIETDRSKLVGKYVGETALLVQKYCNEAMGGVLLVDEAYTLKQSDQDNFGQEAIDTLLKRMEDDRGKFVVIAAGYQKEMQNFIGANPGMKSRVKDNFFHLPDYTPDQLLAILKLFIKKGGYTLDPEAEKKATAHLTQLYNQRSRDFGNGRDVRNFYESILAARATRLVTANESEYNMQITGADIPAEETDLSAGNVALLLEELNALTGLEEVKAEINALVDFLEAERLRSEAGGKKNNINLHCVFTGNPGTGKTTVARILAKIFKSLGVLGKGQLIEVTDKDLVAGYIGQTSAKTDKIVDSAMGGVLFIDEAYTLAAKGQNSFTSEAIDTLLKRMEDDRGKFIVIAAGYTKEMQDFLDSNPGLDSRFARKINFADYPPDALYKIMQGMIKNAGMHTNEETDTRLMQRIDQLYRAKNKSFANARTVRNEFEKILQAQSKRLVQQKRNGVQVDAMALLPDDIIITGEDQSAVSVEKLLNELHSLTGLNAVKNSIHSLVDFLEAEKLRLTAGGKRKDLNLHFVFTGNPGTGKTTVARILAKIFKGLGILPVGQLIEVTDKDLVAPYVGQTSPLTNKVIDSAMGGVLFIDEAYSLSKSSGGFGGEAIDTLLKRMEDDRGKFIVIAAGYLREMEIFLDSNPGLDSRFTQKIEFEDYQPDELHAIFLSLVKSNEMKIDDEASVGAMRYFTALYRNKNHRFANGRTVRNEFEQVLQRQSKRVIQLQRSGQSFDPMLITADDITQVNTD